MSLHEWLGISITNTYSDYSLHNQTLENVQSAKYLGIIISDNMDWGQHISEISSKATKTLGFLRIWSPYSKLQINQVEKVQRTAARWTCRRWQNTSSVGEMLDELEWPSLARIQTNLFLPGASWALDNNDWGPSQKLRGPGIRGKLNAFQHHCQVFASLNHNWSQRPSNSEFL